MGITIAITAGLFAIPAGLSQTQLCQLMGLVGAVAGDILGQDNAHEPTPDAEERKPKTRQPSAPLADI